MNLKENYVSILSDLHPLPPPPRFRRLSDRKNLVFRYEIYYLFFFLSKVVRNPQNITSKILKAFVVITINMAQMVEFVPLNA